MSAFHCQNCGHVTDVTNILQAFGEMPHCPACGLSIHESDTKMQDELADLMANNLRLNHIQPPTQGMSAPSTPPTAPTAYASQHYHHSAHVVTSQADGSATAMLKGNGIDANVLLPCQLQLFQDAQQDQRERLIELWRIAPPTYGNQLMPQYMTNWPQTSFEQEEQAARARWEQQESERLRNLSALPAAAQGHAEPYMTNGYADGHDGMTVPKKDNRHAMEPVYQHSSREWWHMADDEPMEHQYGMVEQLRMMGFCGISNNKDAMMN